MTVRQSCLMWALVAVGLWAVVCFGGGFVAAVMAR